MRLEQETSVYKDETIQSRITAASNAAQAAQTSADGKNTVYYAATEPTGLSFSDGDIWFDTAHNNAIYVYSATQSDWVKHELGEAAIADLSISNAKIADATIQSAKVANLDGGKITAGTISALQLAANSVNAEKLAISDFTNYVTVNEHFAASMNQTAGTETVIDSVTGMVTKADATQQYLPLVTVWGVNPFRNGDEIAYSLNAYSENAGNVDFRIVVFDGNQSWLGSLSITLSLTTATQAFSGTLKVNNAVFDSAEYYSITINDTRATRSQIYVSDASVYRKLAGNLIVDGAITADKVAAGSISTEKLAIGDFQNYATVNENYPSSMNTVSDTATVISAGGMIEKADSQQQNLGLTTQNRGANPFKAGDQVYYSFSAKSDVAGTVYLRINFYDGSGTWVANAYDAVALTTSEQVYEGSLILSNTAIDTAKSFSILLADTRDTKAQISVRNAQVRRKLSGNLIVDGAITADMITAGTMSADRINGGTLTLGGVNDARGVLSILDEDGNNAGTWDNGGLKGAKLLQTAYGNQKKLTFSGGVKAEDETDYGTQTRLRMTPNAIQAINANNNYTSQMIQAYFTGTDWIGNAINTYGWYLTPAAFIKRLFVQGGEVATYNDLQHDMGELEDIMAERL